MKVPLYNVLALILAVFLTKNVKSNRWMEWTNFLLTLNTSPCTILVPVLFQFDCTQATQSPFSYYYSCKAALDTVSEGTTV